ncbi:MAG: DUF4270 family protein [Paludibacteraceae bacterium]|nr:DUF4270 family protein [Paludibacteraceae bacterium]
MKKYRLILIGMLALLMAGCKDDLARTGSSILDPGDSIVVIADTFEISSRIDTSGAIVSLPDSMLLGEIETDYGTMRAQILTQLTCPEGFQYPDNAVIDSISLYFYYTTWVGDDKAPLSINVYEMDGKQLNYAKSYSSDINIADYCSRTKSILRNRRIVVASEKQDSIANSSGVYVPMVRMMTDSTSDFFRRFASIRQYTSQEDFNAKFKGLLIETDFGSSTVLNIRDIAMGVYYHFTYNKQGRDTTVNDLKAFYANSEVRTVNRIEYVNKQKLLQNLQKDSALYNYIISPAGIYTHVSLPVRKMQQSMIENLAEQVYLTDSGAVAIVKRPYVNLAQLQVDVENVFQGATTDKTRNDWLQPSPYMLLIKESAVERVLAGNEAPSDTCAIVSALTTGTDSLGNTTYYYTYDLANMLTRELRQDSVPEQLKMRLVPVSIQTASTSSSSTVISSVREAQTISATKIRSAQSGLNLKLVYSGF